MADNGVFTNIFTLIDDSIVKVVLDKSGTLISVVQPLLLSGFTVYLLFLIVSYWTASLEETAIDLFKKGMTWLVILTFALNISSYNEFVVPMVLGFGDFLAHKFSGSNSSVNGNLDELASIVLDGMKATFDKAEGVSGTLMAVVTIFMIAIASIIFLVISAGYILLAKVFAGMLVIIGPIFIGLALFPATRQFFSAWLNQVVNYTLLTLFISILLAIFIQFMVGAFGTGAIDLARGLNIAIGAGIFFVILLRLPELASSLAGGLSANGFMQAGRTAKSFMPNSKKDGGGKKDSGGSVAPEKQGSSSGSGNK